MNLLLFSKTTSATVTYNIFIFGKTSHFEKLLHLISVTMDFKVIGINFVIKYQIVNCCI